MSYIKKEAKYIQEILEEGLSEFETINGAFMYLLEEWGRSIFEMDEWDETDIETVVIPFEGDDYRITYTNQGIVESTNEHTIIDWRYNIVKI